MEVLGYRIERVLGRGGMSVVYLAEEGEAGASLQGRGVNTFRWVVD